MKFKIIIDLKLKQFQFDIIYIIFSILVLAYILYIMILINFYPTLNDILGILKIASFSGTAKWINGFYGPGYTIIANFIGFKILNWGLLYLFLVFVSLMSSLFYIKKNNYFKLDYFSRYLLLFWTILFHLFLFIKIGLNYSDGIFIFILFTGINLYFSSPYKNSYTNVQIIGILLIGSSILFRTHGLLFGIITLLVLLLSVKASFIHISKTLFILLTPTFIYLGLFYINNIPYQNWQQFNIYKFIYGVNWYQIDILIESNKFKNFNIINTIISDYMYILYRILVTLKIAFFHVILFFIIPAISYFYTRKTFFISIITINTIYFLLILPGWTRGIYPLYILLYITIIQIFIIKSSMKYLWYILMSIFVIYLGVYTKKNFNKTLLIKHYVDYIKDCLEPTLIKIGVKNINRVFTDDYNLYLYKFDILKIKGFNGWLSIHPNKYEEHPNKMFKNLSFKRNNIKYIIMKKGGYIERNYHNFHCNKKITLEFHNICILK